MLNVVTMMKKLFLAGVAALFLATGTAHATDVFEEKAPCGEQALGCAAQASPEIVAVVKKRYPDAENIWAFKEPAKDGKYRYHVAFFTDDGYHRACQLRLRPIKLSNCQLIHA